MDHPAWTFLIDREGMVRYRYLGSLLEVENMLEDIRTLWWGGGGLQPRGGANFLP